MVKILSIIAKPSDCGSYYIYEDGKLAWEHRGYVPRGLGIGGGDYVEIEIDLETGKVVGWQQPDLENIIEES
jgi:hypothetical protein